MNGTSRRLQPPQAAVTKKKDKTYSDGEPFDALHYLQAKILLKADSLTSVDAFRRFGTLVRRTAKSMKIDFIDDPAAGQSPRVREVVFVDTPDFRLYLNGYMLRRRISYVDGFPAGDPEIVFKFRHADLDRAAALDVRPRIPGHFRTKFKVQALPANGNVGAYRTLYSHTSQFGVSQVHEGDRLAMATLTRVFPALSRLKTSKEERVTLVNEGIIEELLLPLGKLDFGKGIVAKTNVALWRTRGEHVPIVGEYAFQLKFNRRDDVPRKTEQRVKDFFVGLQYDVKDWIQLGTTKTGLVYRLKGRAIEQQE